MGSRRDFLKAILGSAMAATAPLLLHGCAGALIYYRAQRENNRIRIPKTEAAALDKENGVMMIKAGGVKGAIVLRNIAGQIIAVSAVCTHRGCEVRPLPDSLQCPCHGSEYDEFGEVIEGPARLPLRRFEVFQKPGSIEIRL